MLHKPPHMRHVTMFPSNNDKQGSLLLMDELFSSLGYGRKESPKDFKRLDRNIQAYVHAAEAKGEHLGDRKRLTDRIVEVGTAYLADGSPSRAQKYWKDNGQGYPVWPIDQTFITDAVCHIFRRKGTVTYIKRCRGRGELRKSGASAPSKQSRKSKKRKGGYESFDEDDDDDEDFLPENLQGLSQTTMKTWNEPPKNPASKSCVEYVQTLNPTIDVDRISELTTEWIRTNNTSWPESADVRLQTFMHNRRFYINYDIGDDVPRDLVNILRKGSAIETLENGLHYVEFQNRIRDRIEALTHRMTKEPYLFLEIQPGGAVHMNKRFSNVWRRKEEIWQKEADDQESKLMGNANKRRKSNIVKLKVVQVPKSPITFPNLRIPSATEGLASMAGAALQMATGKAEDEEMSDERVPVFGEDRPMFVPDALATTCSHTTDRSRSLSAENSIVVDSRGISREGSPNTSPGRSWTPDLPRSAPLQNSGPEYSPTTGVQAGQTSNPVRDRTCDVGPSKNHTPASNRIMPGTNIESSWEILDDGSDDSIDYMAVEEPEAVSLKIEPPAIRNYQSLDPDSPVVDKTAQSHLRQVEAISESQRPRRSSLLDKYPSRFALPPRPSTRAESIPLPDQSASHVLTTPKSPSPLHWEPVALPETASGIQQSPRMSPVSSPTSPLRAFDSFLSHYGNRGLKTLTPSKENHTANSRMLAMSVKERHRAQKQAEVLAEFLEWEDINSRRTKSRTVSPPQTLASSQFQSPGTPAQSTPVSIPVSGIPTERIIRDSSNASSIAVPEPRDDPIQMGEPAASKPTPKVTVSSLPARCTAPTLPDQTRSNSDKSTSGSHVSRKTSSRSNTEASVPLPRSKIRAPLLVPNLTKPLTPMVSKAQTPASTSDSSGTDAYQSPYGADSPRIYKQLKHATPPTFSFPYTPSSNPPSVTIRTASDDLSTPTVPVVPESASKTPSPPPLSLSPSPAFADVRFPSAPLVADQSQATPALLRVSVTPSPATSSSESRCISPSRPISSGSDVSLGTITTAAKVLAAETVEFLKKGAKDGSSIGMTPEDPHERVLEPLKAPEEPVAEQPQGFDAPVPDPEALSEEVTAAAVSARESLNNGGREEPSIEMAPDDPQEKALEPSKTPSKPIKKPPQGSYAHVLDPAPFSAPPSEEEIAMIQALQKPQDHIIQSQHSINREPSVVKTHTPRAVTKTFELLIASASGEMDLENGFSFDEVLNSNSHEFFLFYASVSEAPIDSFQQLIFTAIWGNGQSLRATKQMDESAWKRLKKMIQIWYKQAQTADPEETVFQIMVQIDEGTRESY